MPLSPEQEWTLAACGLVAHADGILEAGEWDRVLWMLDERLRKEDATAWIELLADRERLSAHLDGLAPPMPFFVEPILEKAWRMALADGEVSEHEQRVHDGLAEKLGLPADEVARLRAQWLAQAHKRSELVAGFAAILANLDGQLDDAEAKELDALIERLPVAEGRRPALLAMRDEAPALDGIVAQLLAMDGEERSIALMALVPLVRASAEGERERELFIEVASQLAISTDAAERMLVR